MKLTMTFQDTEVKGQGQVIQTFKRNGEIA